MNTMKTTTLDKLKKQIDPPEEMVYLREQVRLLNSRLGSYKKEHGSILSAVEELKTVLVADPPERIIYTAPKSSKVLRPVAVVPHFTDWHMGACQDADEIEGFNAFDPDTLKRGIMGFVADVHKKVEIQRSNYVVDEMVVVCTGDMISGDIHEELRVTNEWPSPKQTVESANLLVESIKAWAPYFPSVRVEFITEDNHSRLTKKPQAKEAGVNCFNYLVGVIAQARLAQHKNVRFNVHPMYQKTIEVKGRRYLITHGHNVKGWAGFPYYGIERKAGREAIKRMMKNIGKFDKIVLGHWHAPLAHPWYWIGASAQGTDAYDHQNGRYAEPAQSLWFVHPEHGEFDRTDFQLK